MREHAVTLDHE